MRRISTGFEDRAARVEMMPMIDIVFLLLVFFIYAMLSMVVHRGIEVELPEAGTAAVDKADYVSVTITGDNKLFVDEERTNFSSLIAKVREKLEGRDKRIFINSDKRADVGVAIKVLDALRDAGFREASFECVEDGQ